MQNTSPIYSRRLQLSPESIIDNIYIHRIAGSDGKTQPIKEVDFPRTQATAGPRRAPEKKAVIFLRNCRDTGQQEKRTNFSIQYWGKPAVQLKIFPVDFG
jgi:hypothetical protein